MEKFFILLRAMVSRLKYPVVKLFPAGILVMLLGCTEQLPLRLDPTNVLEGKLSPSYLFSSSTNQLSIQLIVTNTYDETFEGRGLFRGRIEITSAKNLENKKTFLLSSSDLIQGQYNQNSRTLTLDSQDSLRLRVQWNFVTDGGNDLRQNSFEYLPDPTCPRNRKIAKAEVFLITGRIKLFDRVGEVRVGPILYTMCHVNQWVPSSVCVSIRGDESCEIQ